MAVRQNYYVYEHWRLDKDECFYVGKGCRGRAYTTSKRGAHWNNIVAKLERIGSGYEVRMVATGMSEKEAFKLERERISFWRDKVDLANKTDGGDGTSGMRHTSESKAKMSAARIGNKNAVGSKHSKEFKDKQRDRAESNNPMKNPDVARKTSESLKALGDNHPTKKLETRKKNSASRRGKCSGDENGSAKLTKEQVLFIYNSDRIQKDLAVEFNVNRHAIMNIKNGKSWSNVTGHENTDKRRVLWQ